MFKIRDFIVRLALSTNILSTYSTYHVVLSFLNITSSIKANGNQFILVPTSGLAAA